MTATESAQTAVRTAAPSDRASAGGRSRRPGFRADIQGLRAVAVVAVIANHLFGEPTGAYVGVDVFFVISGFLITGLMLRESDRTGSVSWVGFYRRRIRRIVPAATAVLAATAVGAAFLFSSARLDATLRDAGYAFLFASNWHFAAVGTDYFQQGLPPSPLQHFWSLAVEEQFYVVWPILVIAVLGLTLRGAAERRRAIRRVLLGAIFSVIAVASFGWAVVQTRDDATVAYFSTLTRAWQLAVGALLALASTQLGRMSDRLRTPLAWLGMVLIVGSCILLNSASAVPAPAGLVPVAGAALVIAAGTGGHRYSGPRMLTNPVAGYLGQISYSLYLWHFPVIVLLATVLSPGPGYDLIALMMTLVLATGSYLLIEEPVRRSRWLERSGPRTRARTWLLLVGALVLVAGAVTVRDVQAHRTSGPATVAGVCVGAAAMDPAATCTVRDMPAATPPVGDAETDVGDAFSCWTDPNATAPRSCRYGHGTVKVALIGDSHAAMLLPALMTGLGAHNWTLTTYLGWGCLWLTGGVGSTCDTEMATIQQHLLTGPKYDLVVTTAARQRLPAGADPDVLSRAFAAEWKPVLARGSHVAVLADNPVYGASAARCVNKVGFRPADACSTSIDEAFAAPDPLVRAAALAPGAELVDLRSFYCTATGCPAVIGNVLVYRDTISHLTATFSRSLAPYLFAAIGAAIPTSG